MDRTTEQRVLQRAVDEGVLSAAELEEHARDMAQWGPQLSSVIRSGLLGAAMAQRFLDDVTSGAGGMADDDSEPAPSLRPATGGAGASERFEVGDLLGQGGMAKVFKAYDRSLKRHLALKFLKSDDPDRIARFQREAQAQARVVHENVCKIYEVGELDGKPFIAMQLIEGQPLFVTGRQSGSAPATEEAEVSQASPMLAQMTVDQKARLMLKVAEGIHVAHREGLIHRDIKPSNIIVEAVEGGDFKPYVLDFGLAREVASAGQTTIGLAAGTPNFMAPEQARGEAGALDRRTDVYGLGATLYALLAGSPPFEGSSSLDVLINVTEREAPPLTGVPEDLATIVGKCLEKEPAQRYDSARAVAEDLGRYLNGDPILGRKTSLGRRLLKKARKHKKLALAGALTGAAFLTLAGWSIGAQLRSKARARLAGVFGQEVKGIESIMQVAHLIPEHDIRPEKAAIRRRMSEIERQIRNIGSVADGPGHYALGRGHLALGEPEQARQDLDLAWKAGYREREVSYALGLTMGSLYQRGLEAADRIGDKKTREARKQELQTQYRDPALRYLEQSRGMDMESPEYVEALMAFYEKRYDVTLAKARAAYERVPSLYEARALEARAHGAIAREDGLGGKSDEGLQAAQRAIEAFAAAEAIGRSDSQVSSGSCSLAFSIVQMRLYAKGGDLSSEFQRALGAANRALRIDPENADAYLCKAQMLWRTAEVEERAGRDPRALLAQSVETYQHALRLRPGDSNVYYGMGAATTHQVTYEGRQGIDPSVSAARADQYLEAALRINPNDNRAHNERGIVLSALAQYQSSAGIDPTATFQRAADSVQRALSIKYDDLALRSLVLIYVELAAHEIRYGRDPSKELDLAAATVEKARAFAPDALRNHYCLARVFHVRAEYELAARLDPKSSLDRALEAYQRMLAGDPEFAEGFLRMAQLQALLARDTLNKGGDPAPALEGGRKWTAQIPAGSAGNRPQLVEGQLELLQGRWQMSRGRSPVESFSRAIAAAQQAVERSPNDADGYILVAQAHERMAAWQASQGRAAGPEVSRGSEAAEEALRINPKHPEALAVRDALRRQQTARRTS
jgi:serine/threonine-protein kinase